MAAPPTIRENREQQTSLELSFEGLDGAVAGIHVYFFDCAGALIGRQAVHQGRVKLAPAENPPEIAHILVGPAVDDDPIAPPTLTEFARFHMYEANFPLVSGQHNIVLPPIPETIWRWWLVHSVWAQMRKHTAQASSASVLF